MNEYGWAITSIYIFFHDYPLILAHDSNWRCTTEGPFQCVFMCISYHFYTITAKSHKVPAALKVRCKITLEWILLTK